MKRLLVVEDDAPTAAGLVRGLRAAGFQVDLETDGDSALRALLREPPALAILDLNLPGRDGYLLLEAWRPRTSTPIFVVTAATEPTARTRALALGADEFYTKPIFMNDLVARIRERIAGATSAREVRWDDVIVDLDARTVRHGDGALVELTAHEYNLLAYLAERPGRAVTREALAAGALPIETEHARRTVDTHLTRIRKKLGPGGRAIQTVWGIGYRLDPS